jgi:hypothetical protein
VRNKLWIRQDEPSCTVARRLEWNRVGPMNFSFYKNGVVPISIVESNRPTSSC